MSTAKGDWDSSHDIAVNVLNCDIVVSELKLQLTLR